MSRQTVSVNDAAKRKVDALISEKDGLKVNVLKKGKATVIDAGIHAKGSYEAGALVTEICMGGLGTASVHMKRYDDVELPTITVATDFPLISLLGSQLAGWRIKVENFFAMGSGPARALSLEPKELYDQLGYQDESRYAILVMETQAVPQEEVLEHVASKCRVDLENLYVVVAPTSTIVGSTQIAGRITETGLHKLHSLGFDPKAVVSGIGTAPIAPIHPDNLKAMGRTNDVIFFAGSTYYTVKFDDDTKLADFVRKAPSSYSKDYGKPFHDVFKAAEYDFFKIDPNLFAPAEIVVNNLTTGKTLKAGKLNIEILKKSIDLLNA